MAAMREELFVGDEVEVGGDVAGPLRGVSAAVGAAAVGEEDGLVKDGADGVGAEPGGGLADGLRIGVVEVVAGSEELDGHGAGSTGAGGEQGVEMAGVEAVLEEDVGGESGMHGERVQEWG
jgi:hypothetical protein